ncbi:MAG: phosphoglycerate mutase [Micrococcales bacterium]|nr:MAG: phosphoglycerate mutase [Micrococcales bacterium]PIE27685.1 MAG: phosphoglycerate mutase [Micrococcales bacterium]
MPTVLLIRHGRTAANAAAVLAGRSPGVDLDEEGRRQVTALARRAAEVPLTRMVASPMQRTVATARILLGGLAQAPQLLVDERITECDYGEWTGKQLTDLAQEPMWRTVQVHPSAAVFPGGEALAAVAARGVAAIRSHDAVVRAEHGEHAVWAAVSHGDIIKAVLADALGTHLDQFQRISVGPCSVSVVTYTEHRPFVVRMNDVGGDLAGLVPPPAADGDAAVGGGS